MSDLQRSFARAHLTQLPPRPPPIFDEREEDEDVSDLPLESPTDSSSSASSTGTIIPLPDKNLFERAKECVDFLPSCYAGSLALLSMLLPFAASCLDSDSDMQP